MTTAQALEQARALCKMRGPHSEELPCGVCFGIAAALMRAWADGMEAAGPKCLRQNHKPLRFPLCVACQMDARREEKMERIRAEADKMERGE